MTQPLVYVRQYNFTDWSTNHPGEQQPGVSLDAEFNSIKITTDQVRANMALLQRDDGRQANGSVHKDAFDSTALALIAGSTGTGWNPKGSWLTGTAYARLDMVANGTTTYVCITGHTSGVFATDLAAGLWLAVAYTPTYTAAQISFTPFNNLVATNVQAALAEIDTREITKAPVYAVERAIRRARTAAAYLQV